MLDRRHLPTLRAGGVTVVCDHVGGDAPYGYLPATRLSTSYLQRFMRALDHTHAELEQSDHFILAKTTADILRAKRERKIAFVICLEGGAPLEQEISYLRNFYRLGLRCLGLTHDVRNEIGDGVRERSAEVSPTSAQRSWRSAIGSASSSMCPTFPTKARRMCSR